MGSKYGVSAPIFENTGTVRVLSLFFYIFVPFYHLADRQENQNMTFYGFVKDELLQGWFSMGKNGGGNRTRTGG